MQPKDLAGLYTYIDAVYSTNKASPLHVFITIPQIKISDLERVCDTHHLQIHMKSTDSPKLFSLNLGIRKRSVSGWLINSDSYWTFLIQPAESSAAAGQITEAWLSDMMPSIEPARVTSDSIIDMLEELDHVEHGELRIHSYTLKRQGTNPYKLTQKSWEGRVSFDRKKIIDYARTAGRLVDAAHISMVDEGKLLFEAMFSRSGHLIYHKGNETGFSTFLRLIVARIAQRSINRLNEYQNLEARVVGDEVMVNEMDYDLQVETETFDDGLETLEKALLRNSRYSISIDHTGNPWYSLNVTDRGDGSSFNLNVYAHVLQIVPFTKATAQSISLLSSLIEEVYPLARRQEKVIA